MHVQSILAAVAAMSALATAKPMPQGVKDRLNAIKSKRSFGADFGPRPLKVAKTTVGGPDGTASADDTADTEYSTNWSGSIINAASGESFSSAVGTVTIPSCSNPNDGSTGPWYNAYWVGIDGATDGAGLLQAGVICEIDTDNTESYYPWVEFFPTGLITIDDFTVNQGDSFTVTIDVINPTSGSIVLSDDTSGQTFTTTLDAPSPTNTLAGLNAEWILEDFSSGGGLVPFASFGPCTWTASSANYADGTTVDAASDGWNPVLLQDSNGNTITSVAANGDDSITITYGA